LSCKSLVDLTFCKTKERKRRRSLARKEKRENNSPFAKKRPRPRASQKRRETGEKKEGRILEAGKKNSSREKNPALLVRNTKRARKEKGGEDSPTIEGWARKKEILPASQKKRAKVIRGGEGM